MTATESTDTSGARIPTKSRSTEHSAENRPPHPTKRLRVTLTQSYVIEDDVLVFLPAGSLGVVTGARREKTPTMIQHHIEVQFAAAVLDGDGDGTRISQWTLDVRPEHLAFVPEQEGA
jgi:hypothetical protein